MFERQTMCHVQEVWSDLCVALVQVDQDIPQTLQTRQNNIGAECARLRSRIGYGADTVEQNKSLEAIVRQLDDLERRQEDVVNRASSLSDEHNGMFPSLTCSIASNGQTLTKLTQYLCIHRSFG